MILGFTGTRTGMSREQRKRVDRIIDELSPTLAVHGDCVGADDQFHDLCLDHHIPIEIYPCILLSQRANCKGALCVHPPRDPLLRNHDIVDRCDLLLATPKGNREVMRSGTWATIRYALRRGKKVRIVYSDGSFWKASE